MPSLLIVGGGHASVALLHRAARLGADRVTLVSEHRTLVYSGMTPEWLGGVYYDDEPRIDLAALAHRNNVTLVEATATRLAPAERTVWTADGRAFSADLVVFDVGSGTRDVPGAGTLPVKPLHRLRGLQHLVREAAPGTRLVFIGGGAAGVELALNVSARRPDFRLTLVEPAARLLGAFPDATARAAGALLHAHGVAIRCGARATHADATGVRLETGEHLPADAVVRATGPVGVPLFADAGLACDSKGFVRVTRSLQVHGHPALLAAGDCAVVDGHDHLPRVGVYAVQQGPYLVRVLRRLLHATNAGLSLDRVALPPWRPYPVAPLILSTGTPDGLLAAGPVGLRGRAMLRLKHLADLRWMRRYRPGRWPLPDLVHGRHAHPEPR